MSGFAALLSSLFTSIISGGVTGILGVAVQRYFDLKNKSISIESEKLRYTHEENLKTIDLEILEKEWEGRVKVAETETEGRIEVSENEAFKGSYNEPERYSENVKTSKFQGWLFVLLDFIRGMVRPTLTIYLCGVTTVVYMQARELLSTTPVPVSDALELVKLIIGTVLYLTTTCVLWWFGTRNKKPQPNGEIK